MQVLMIHGVYLSFREDNSGSMLSPGQPSRRRWLCKANEAVGMRSKTSVLQCPVLGRASRRASGGGAEQHGEGGAALWARSFSRHQARNDVHIESSQFFIWISFLETATRQNHFQIRAYALDAVGEVTTGLHLCRRCDSFAVAGLGPNSSGE